MLAGTGLAHRLGLAASPAGVPEAGWIALALGCLITFGIAWMFTFARVPVKEGA